MAGMTITSPRQQPVERDDEKGVGPDLSHRSERKSKRQTELMGVERERVSALLPAQKNLAPEKPDLPVREECVRLSICRLARTCPLSGTARTRAFVRRRLAAPYWCNCHHSWNQPHWYSSSLCRSHDPSDPWQSRRKLTGRSSHNHNQHPCCPRLTCCARPVSAHLLPDRSPRHRCQHSCCHLSFWCSGRGSRSEHPLRRPPLQK